MRYLKITLVIGGVVIAILLCSLLLFAGFELILSVGTVLMVALAVYFGAIKEFAGSIILTFLFTVLKTEIQSIVSIWWSGPNSREFFSILERIGHGRLFLLMFFVVYGISFLTSRFKLFHCKMEGEVTIAPQKAEKELDDPSKGTRSRN